MKQTTFKKLQSAVQSIQDCTKLNIECGAVGVTLDGRASPFISHRTVEYYSIGSGDEKRPGTVFSGNYDMVVGINPEAFRPGDAGPPDRNDLETEWEIVEVPMQFVRELILLAREYGVDNYAVDINVPLVTVAIAIPRLYGWTEYDVCTPRCPVFRACEGDFAGQFVARPVGGCWTIVQPTEDKLFTFPPEDEIK